MYTSIHIGDKAEKLAMRYDEDNLKYELDRAIEIIGQMRTEAIRRRLSATNDQERQDALDEIAIYNREEQVIYGYADEEVRQSVFDKVFRFYSPLLKMEREQ